MGVCKPSRVTLSEWMNCIAKNVEVTHIKRLDETSDGLNTISYWYQKLYSVCKKIDDEYKINLSWRIPTEVIKYANKLSEKYDMNENCPNTYVLEAYKIIENRSPTATSLCKIAMYFGIIMCDQTTTGGELELPISFWDDGINHVESLCYGDDVIIEDKSILRDMKKYDNCNVLK